MSFYLRDRRQAYHPKRRGRRSGLLYGKDYLLILSADDCAITAPPERETPRQALDTHPSDVRLPFDG